MPKVAILGSGGWGLALSMMAYKCGHDVTVWSLFPEEIEALERDREHKKLLPGVKLPEGITFTSKLEDITDARLVVLAVPSAPIDTVGFDMVPMLVVKVTVPLFASTPAEVQQVAVMVACMTDPPLSLTWIVSALVVISMLDTKETSMVAVRPSALTVTVAESGSTEES